MTPKPTLAITMGDPMGIGPEVVVKALPSIRRFSHPIVFGSAALLEYAAQLTKTKVPPSQELVEPDAISLGGRLTKRRCGEASLAFIEDAVAAVRSHDCDALVTGPICKEHINTAGSPYPGHTEMLAGLARSRQKTFLMMVGKSLTVTLVTLHEPLAKVPHLLSKRMVGEAIGKTHEVLEQRFRIRRPRIAVAGLNPHAGEGGLFGHEERDKIVPAIKAARRKKMQVEGPLPGDTVFYQALQGQFDAVISMYHDQGLIPVKLLHFEDAVNMTLGLPFIRTSVDHGVAFDIAWKNEANPASMIAAAKLAARLVK